MQTETVDGILDSQSQSIVCPVIHWISFSQDADPEMLGANTPPPPLPPHPPPQNPQMCVCVCPPLCGGRGQLREEGSGSGTCFFQLQLRKSNIYRYKR